MFFAHKACIKKVYKRQTNKKVFHVSVKYRGNLGGGGGCSCVCRAHPRWQHGVGFAASAAAAVSLHKDVPCTLFINHGE